MNRESQWLRVLKKIEISGLPVGTLRPLETLGRKQGKGAEEYARTVIEVELLSQESFDEILQPVREQFAASGMTINLKIVLIAPRHALAVF
jgi:hypothetical protein